MAWGIYAQYKIQNAPMLALFLEYAEGDLGIISDLLSDGRRRQKPRHRTLLAEAHLKSENRNV